MRVGTRAIARAVPVLVAAGLWCGCATVPVEESFVEARGLAAERAGGAAARVDWIGVTATETEVRAKVRELLSDGLSADEAVQVALVNNRRLQARFAQLGAAAARRTEAGLPPNPVLDAVLRFEQGGDGDVFELSLMEDLWDLVLLPRRRRVAAAELERARLEVVAAVLDLAGATRRRLYALQGDREALALARESLLAAEAAAEMAMTLREAGNVAWLDVLAERDRLEMARLTVARLEMEVAEGREALDQLLHLWGPDTAWELVDELPPLPSEPGDLSGLESQAVERSVDLAQALLAVEAAGRRLGIERITSVLGEVEVGAEGEEEIEEGDSVWWVGPGLSLSLPLFHQGQPRTTAARMEVRRLWDLYSALAVDVRTAARRAGRRLLYAHQRAAYLDAVVVPLRTAITGETHLHYNAMSMGVFELLRAKRSELDAGQREIEARVAYWTARSELDQLLAGRMSPGLAAPGMMAPMDEAMMAASGGGH